MIIKAKLSGLQISDNMAIKFIAFFVWVIALCPLYGQSNWRLDLSSNAKSTDFGVIDDGVVAIQQLERDEKHLKVRMFTVGLDGILRFDSIFSMTGRYLLGNFCISDDGKRFAFVTQKDTIGNTKKFTVNTFLSNGKRNLQYTFSAVYCRTIAIANNGSCLMVYNNNVTKGTVLEEVAPNETGSVRTILQYNPVRDNGIHVISNPQGGWFLIRNVFDPQLAKRYNVCTPNEQLEIGHLRNGKYHSLFKFQEDPWMSRHQFVGASLVLMKDQLHLWTRIFVRDASEINTLQCNQETFPIPRKPYLHHDTIPTYLETQEYQVFSFSLGKRVKKVEDRKKVLNVSNKWSIAEGTDGKYLQNPSDGLIACWVGDSLTNTTTMASAGSIVSWREIDRGHIFQAVYDPGKNQFRLERLKINDCN